MLTGGVRSVEVVEEMSAKERASYLARQCHGREEGVKGRLSLKEEEAVKQEKEDRNSKGSVFFLMRAGGGSKEMQGGGAEEESKDVLVCAPPHSAAKAVFQQINEQVLRKS